MAEQPLDPNPLLLIEFEKPLSAGAMFRAKLSIPRWTIYVAASALLGAPVVPQIVRLFLR